MTKQSPVKISNGKQSVNQTTTTGRKLVAPSRIAVTVDPIPGPYRSKLVEPILGPYRAGTAIGDAFLLSQRPLLKSKLVTLPWFGKSAGLHATLRRTDVRHGKNGWIADLLIDGKPAPLSALASAPATATIQTVNVRRADAADILRLTQTAHVVRGSQQLADADRNPITGKILASDEPATTSAPAAIAAKNGGKK